MKTEKWLSAKLRDPLLIKKLKIISFEMCQIPGVPDLYCVAPAVKPFWLELKVAQSRFCKIPFRPHQPQWLDAHAKAGGSAHILVWLEDTQSILVVKGSECRLLATLKLRDAACWIIAEIPFSGVTPWERLEKVLLAPLHHRAEAV